MHSDEGSLMVVDELLGRSSDNVVHAMRWKSMSLQCAFKSAKAIRAPSCATDRRRRTILALTWPSQTERSDALFRSEPHSIDRSETLPGLSGHPAWARGSGEPFARRQPCVLVRSRRAGVDHAPNGPVRAPS